jgi:hypothetical protein
MTPIPPLFTLQPFWVEAEESQVSAMMTGPAEAWKKRIARERPRVADDERVIFGEVCWMMSLRMWLGIMYKHLITRWWAAQGEVTDIGRYKRKRAILRVCLKQVYLQCYDNFKSVWFFFFGGGGGGKRKECKLIHLAHLLLGQCASTLCCFVSLMRS